MATEGRIKSLDGLKGLLCIPILMVHYKAIANHWEISGDCLPFYNLIGVF